MGFCFVLSVWAFVLSFVDRVSLCYVVPTGLELALWTQGGWGSGGGGSYLRLACLCLSGTGMSSMLLHACLVTMFLKYYILRNSCFLFIFLFLFLLEQGSPQRTHSYVISAQCSLFCSSVSPDSRLEKDIIMNSPHLPNLAFAWFWELTNPFCIHPLEHRPELSKQEGWWSSSGDGRRRSPKHQFLECPCWSPGAQERALVCFFFLCYLQDKHLPGGFCGSDWPREEAPGHLAGTPVQNSSPPPQPHLVYAHKSFKRPQLDGTPFLGHPLSFSFLINLE